MYRCTSTVILGSLTYHLRWEINGVTQNKKLAYVRFKTLPLYRFITTYMYQLNVLLSILTSEPIFSL